MLTSFALASALAAPATVDPTTEEWGKLQAGEVVVRSAPDLVPPGAYGWVEVKATDPVIWDVLNDPEVAKGAGGAVQSVEKYLDESVAGSRKVGLHYVLNVAWTEVEYFVLRDLRPAESRMTWTLDPSKASDLVATTGSYLLASGRTPGTRLLSYATQTDSGRNVPQWIQDMLTGKALRGYLGHVDATAEARG